MPADIRDPASGRMHELDRVNFLGAGLSGTNLETGSSHNLRVTLQAIRLNAPITKVELAEITGLTAQSITNISRKLREDGLIVDAGRRRGERGQPAMRLAINPDAAYSIGINIDRDHITMIALDFLGKMRFRKVEKMAFAMPDQVADFVARGLDAIREERDIDGERIVGIGVAMPDDFGKVDLPQRPKDFGIWEAVDLKNLLGGHGIDVFIENDATAAAVGELQFGHGRSAQTFFYLLVSSGLGGGLVIDGHPFEGASGRSGEIGFLPIRKAKRGGGDLQDVVSISGLLEHLAREGISDIELTEEFLLTGPVQDAVRDWAEISAGLLCDPLLVVNAVINPEAIFIGGQLPAGVVDILCDQLSLKIRRHGASLPARAPVGRAALAEDAAAMGAAILPFSSRFLPSRTAMLKTEA